MDLNCKDCKHTFNMTNKEYCFGGLILCPKCKSRNLNAKFSKSQTEPKRDKKHNKKHKRKKNKRNKKQKTPVLSAKKRYIDILKRFDSMKDAYAFYRKSSHWKKLRRKKLKEVNFCEMCHSRSMLQVHHLEYKRWFDVELTDLMTLCRECHKNVHGIDKETT